MSEITVVSAVPAVAVMLDMATIDRIGILAERVAATQVRTEAERATAEALFNEVDTLARAIEARRKALKAPARAYGDAVDAAAKDAQAVLQPTLEKLGSDIAAQLRREDEQRRAEEARLAAEARALQEQENAKADAAAAFSGDVTEHLPARIDPPKALPPPKSNAIKRTVEYVLVIPDRSKVPVEFAGAELRPIDEAQLKRLLRSGVTCEFARLDEVESFARKGSR